MNLSQVRRFSMSLPEVTEEPHHHVRSFRVRGKIFVTFAPELEHIHVFVSEQERELALILEPSFLEKLLWGGKVMGLKVLLPEAKPSFVKSLLSKAWAEKAPKALVAQLAQARKV